MYDGSAKFLRRRLAADVRRARDVLGDYVMHGLLDFMGGLYG